ncbi:MAG: hypothetical protein ACYTGZ_17555 [Planctomycetota bacterium]|jgi:hypothetical protein
MGTFHSDKGDLHGITVVVQTHGNRVYVGRCDEEKPDGIHLLDVDHHDDGDDGRSTADYLDRAHKFGVFAKEKMLFVPRAEIAEIRRLG